MRQLGGTRDKYVCYTVHEVSDFIVVHQKMELQLLSLTNIIFHLLYIYALKIERKIIYPLIFCQFLIKHSQKLHCQI